MKKRNLLSFIFGGLMFRYGIDIFDMIVSMLQNKQAVYATKLQLKVNELVETTPQVYDDGNLIGFTLPDEEEYYEDEE